MELPKQRELSNFDTAMIDIYKHGSTLSTGAIVILAGFLSRPASTVLNRPWLVAMAVAGFAVCIGAGLAGMVLVIKEWREWTKVLERLCRTCDTGSELPDFRGSIPDLTSAICVSHVHIAVKWTLLVSFAISMGCLVAFVFSNMP